MNNQLIQRDELAGKRKLTAVTIGHGTNKRQFFVMLEHNSKGEAILPMNVLDNLLSKVGIGYGQGYTVA